MRDVNTPLHRFGPFELDPAARELRRDGRVLPLRPRPLALLQVFAERPGRVLTKDELLDAAWPGVIVEDNNLQVQVSVLRKLIGNGAITTIAGRGYRFELPVEAGAHSAGFTAPALDGGTDEGLLGRREDLSALWRSVHQGRLVTLTGPGGIGKTRLAHAMLRGAGGSFSDGAHWVDLAAVADPELLAARVRDALPASAASAAASNAQEDLLRALRDKQLLLVLDNAEQLLDAVAAFAAWVLQQTQGVRLVVTSQAPLRVPGEQVLRLGPLSLPPPGASVQAASGYGAVALFARRAQAGHHRFTLDEASLPRVLEICRRLDGIPLALELAAARLPAFGLAGLASLLDERFGLLSMGQRDAPERQQTLTAVFDWSFRLLGPREQAVFRRLGVLSGGFTLQEAGELALDTAGDDRPPAAGSPWEVFDALAALVDHSLVSMDDSDPPRYSLLETGRAYALARLIEAGESHVIARASRWYEAAGDRASQAASGTAAFSAYSVALELARGLPAGAARDEREIELGVKLGPAIQATLGPTHPRCEQVYRRSVELARAGPAGEHAFKAIWGYWQFLTLSGRDRDAAPYAREIMAMAPVLGDDGLELEALHAAMTTSDMLGDAPAVIVHARQIGRIYDRCKHHRLTFSFGGHDPGVCALGQGAVNLWLTGSPGRAREMAGAALALAQTLEHGYSRATGAFYAAIAYAACGDTDALERTADALVLLSDQYRMEMLLTEGHIFRGRARYERGRAEGIDEVRQAFARVEASRDLGFVFVYVSLFVDALLATGQLDEAEAVLARAIGYAELGQGLFLPEVFRLRGELRMARGDARGFADFDEAAAIAGRQGAVALELRARDSAARHGPPHARQ